MTDLDIKAAVRARDGNRCVSCGMTSAEHYATYGRDLDVHRIVPGSSYSTEPGVAETVCRRCHGSRPKRRQGTVPDGPLHLAKIDRGIARKAKQVAAHHGVTLAGFLSEILAPLVARDWQGMLASMDAEFSPPADPES